MALDPFIGEIGLFGFNFAPRGWAQCQGQLLSIAQNTALFSLLGTTYGGNGQTTFALPDLRGRIAIAQGQGPGLPDYSIGEQGGAATTTLLAANLPAHSHAVTGTASLPATSSAGTQDNPSGAIPAGSAVNENFAAPGTPPAASLAPAPLATPTQPAGTGQPFAKMPPCLALNYCIATQGIFPARN